MKTKTHAIIISVIVTVISFTGYNMYISQDTTKLSVLALANIEALANQSEGGTGNTVDCYSSSDAKKGSSYYNCGTCTSVLNSKGTGNMRQCIAN